MIVFLAHPFRGFGGVADGIGGLIAQHDAAGEGRRCPPVGALHVLVAGSPVDARDEQLGGKPLVKQADGGIDAAVAAGQGHDGIGSGGGVPRIPQGAGGKYPEADDQSEQHYAAQHDAGSQTARRPGR